MFILPVVDVEIKSSLQENVGNEIGSPKAMCVGGIEIYGLVRRRGINNKTQERAEEKETKAMYSISCRGRPAPCHLRHLLACANRWSTIQDSMRRLRSPMHARSLSTTLLPSVTPIFPTCSSTDLSTLESIGSSLALLYRVA